MSAESLSVTYNKLSSGLRITKASDDAAGLSVADTLRAQRRTATVALRNVNDGISFMAMVDGALDHISSVLIRMSELANQAASGTYSGSQRSALDGEAQSLSSEIDRIVYTTAFNGTQLIKKSYIYLTVQAGLDNSSSSRMTVYGIDGLTADLPINGLTLATSSSASAAISNINTTINLISGYRGTFGAFEARLRSAANTLNVTSENFAAAESRIRDADIAQESAELTRLTILQQAGAAVLAQANQSPALALQLLG